MTGLRDLTIRQLRALAALSANGSVTAAANKLNRARRRGLTEEGRARLRASALAHKPWRYSTGPRTQAGKRKVALNGKKRQLGPRSVREIKADLSGVRDLLQQLKASRHLIESMRPGLF